jgi:hypothetical protein
MVMADWRNSHIYHTARSQLSTCVQSQTFCFVITEVQEVNELDASLVKQIAVGGVGLGDNIAYNP